MAPWLALAVVDGLDVSHGALKFDARGAVTRHSKALSILPT